MKKRKVSNRTLGALAATRGMLGMGAGLLLSKRVQEARRKKIGLALLGIGVVSTVPIAWKVFKQG